MAYKEYPSQERMKSRIKVLRNLIEASPGVETKKAIAVLSLRYGLKERTIREYLTTLKNAGIVKEDNDCLFLTALPAANDETAIPSDSLSPAERKYIDAALVVSQEVEKTKYEGVKNAKKPGKRKRGRPKGS